MQEKNNSSNPLICVVLIYLKLVNSSTFWCVCVYIYTYRHASIYKQKSGTGRFKLSGEEPHLPFVGVPFKQSVIVQTLLLASLADFFPLIL